MVNQMSIETVCIADRHHSHLLFPTQLKTWGKKMVQQAVLQKRMTQQVWIMQNKKDQHDCFIQESWYNLFALILGVKFWYVWDEVSHMLFPPDWMGMVVLRCLVWTVVQGKWVQHAAPHLFSLSWTTFSIVCLHHFEMPLLYFAGETCTNPHAQGLWACCFLSCFGSPGCIQRWILQVSYLTEPKSQSKTQQSSSIICLTHTWKHQSVMVPLKQISVFSKFYRNFAFVT